jgi:xanthine/uracil permease
MFWKLLGLLVILGIGIPVLMNIYDGFLNSTNGSWNNWTIAYNTSYCGTTATYTTACVTAYNTFERGIFQMIPIFGGLMMLGFILYLLSGGFSKPDNMPPIGR